MALWRCRESNPVPLACKASALPYELHPHAKLPNCGYSLVERVLLCRATASGVNAMLVPEAGGAAVSHVRALAPDGRCKSFGAEGDGYGRGEVLPYTQ